MRRRSYFACFWRGWSYRAEARATTRGCSRSNFSRSNFLSASPQEGEERSSRLCFAHALPVMWASMGLQGQTAVDRGSPVGRRGGAVVSMDRRLSTAEHDPKTIGNAPSPGQTLRWAPPEREGVWRARAQRRAAQPRTFEAGPAHTPPRRPSSRLCVSVVYQRAAVREPFPSVDPAHKRPVLV